VAIAERARIDQQEEKDKEAEARRTAETDAFQKQLADADKKVVELQKQQTPRRLTEQQKQTLVATLAPFRGQKLTIQTILGDAECKQFLEDFVAVFDDAGWDHNGGSGILYSMFSTGGDPIGVMIIVSQRDVASRNGPPAVAALSDVLRDFGLVPNRRFFTDDELASWSIKLVIGRKPRDGFVNRF
jgi:hypothetical protein